MPLSVANLVDNSVIDDGWWTFNRGTKSANAGITGITGTQNVFWNNRGIGNISSYQFGMGYVIGTQGLNVRTTAAEAGGGSGPNATPWEQGTEPFDYTEHIGNELSVASLYEDQLARRLGGCE